MVFKKKKIKEPPRWQEKALRRISPFAQQRPAEDFSSQQEVLLSLFGRGEKVWGTKMQPIELNFDLNPSQLGDTGTGELFGLERRRRKYYEQ